MAILIDKETRALIQGITGNVGLFQTQMMMEYGTNIVAGVTPGKGGREIHGIPVFDFIQDAIDSCQPNAVLSFVPAEYTLDAAIEAIDCGMKLLVLTAEGIPDHDVAIIIRYASSKGTLVIGPDTPGLISPGKCKLGVHPAAMFIEGSIGVVSKSGALSYEVCRILTEKGLGQSTVVGIGGGPLWGLSQLSILQMFEEDPDTEIIVLLGEVGGKMEQEAAYYIKENVRKPVIALIVGRSAPVGAQMGHAGAIIDGSDATASYKTRIFKEAGAHIANNPLEVSETIARLMK